MNRDNMKIMSIFTRTPLHVGAGNSVGAVDAPVMRERHTRIPIIPGSSLKGVLADLWNDESFKRTAEGKWLFGEDEGGQKKDGVEIAASAGALLIGEGRVLAFPVRSARNSFAWITCPLVLERFKRDSAADYEVPEVKEENKCFATEALKLQDSVVLEEYRLPSLGNPDEKIVQALKNALDDAVWNSLKERLCIVSDEMFCYFAEHACEVVTRIKVDDETGTVAGGALFNQEQVPSETMFYAVIGAQDEKKKGGGDKKADAALKTLSDRLTQAGNILQIGGDETIGLGYCTVNLEVE
jgi:CRISPR-associated protein Cmr4